MVTLFIDTNIVVDLLLERAPFYKAAEDIFSLSDKGNVNLIISALTVPNTHYLISKLKSKELANQAISKFKVLVTIISLSDKIIELALSDDKFPDFEDGLQYYSAIDANCDYIITRDLKDFKHSRLPVMTAENYILSIQ
ncbi:type II toxin-antitoxin system VapC family toxin [Polaribacter porphyrae]|uniref:Twitching motility protein PilT n=1 Tax=Polaribacter porphyrae TaxID=1137780 RepID=A0A2S7WKZ3_9FLAO|nr:PIN domain-containing protein [Polaribacter porphyrae]PQJ78277.1 twitching motility protein PilT [Polaribacter porphyrae]